MSTVESPSGPRTIQVPGNGGGILDFTLPPGITLDLESVLVVVDTTSAGPTVAELVIAEQSGVVIATKRQSEALDPLLFGTATWALRLDDDGGGGGAATAIEYAQFADHTGVIVPVGSVTPLNLVYEAGTLNVGLAGQLMTFLTAGTYTVDAWMNMGAGLGDYVAYMRVRIFTSDPTLTAVVSAPKVSTSGFTGGGPAWTVTRSFAAGDTIDFFASVGANGGGRQNLYGVVSKLA